MSTGRKIKRIPRDILQSCDFLNMAYKINNPDKIKLRKGDTVKIHSKRVKITMLAPPKSPEPFIGYIMTECNLQGDVELFVSTHRAIGDNRGMQLKLIDSHLFNRLEYVENTCW